MQRRIRLDGLLQAEATGNAPNFPADGRYLYDLPRTDASVAWIWEPGFYGGYDAVRRKASPDIREWFRKWWIDQDWSAGNAIDILFSCTNQPSQDLQFLAYGYCADIPSMTATPASTRLRRWRLPMRPRNASRPASAERGEHGEEPDHH